MGIKFSEDVVPMSDMKVNPGKIVRQITEQHRPVLLTSRGRGVAVVESLEDFERKEDERAFMQAVIKGMTDLDEGRETSLAEARKMLLVSDQ